jgi:hypothetical protein
MARPARAYQMLHDLAVCPDCSTLLVFTGHQALAFQRKCTCFACWHYDLFATPEGWDIRQQWSRFGTTACAAYAEGERQVSERSKPRPGVLQLSTL